MPRKLPKVSIVLPTYNRAKLLHSALHSIVAQSFQDWELIVVDDCSKDDTQKVVDSIHDPRICYLRHKNNKGGSAARNTGIRKSVGEFVAFLDDDDLWEFCYLEEQLNAMAAYDAVTSGYRLSNETPRSSGSAVVPITSSMLRKGYAGCGTSGLMIRRPVIESLMFDESLPSGQDWDLLMRLTQRYRVGFLPEPLVVYEQGTHSRISNQIANSPISVIEKHIQVFLKHKPQLGTFWFNYHVARLLLYGIKSRENRFEHFCYTIKRCGFVAVTAYFSGRLFKLWEMRV